MVYGVNVCVMVRRGLEVQLEKWEQLDMWCRKKLTQKLVQVPKDKVQRQAQAEHRWCDEGSPKPRKKRKKKNCYIPAGGEGGGRAIFQATPGHLELLSDKETAVMLATYSIFFPNIGSYS